MYAVILASGSGTRQRPLGAGQEARPFAQLASGRTVLQQTVARLAGLVQPADVVVVTDRRHGQFVREQLPEARILAEPRNRGTAASLALACAAVERAADEVMLVACADHEVEREDELRRAIGLVASQVAPGLELNDAPLVTFGIRPTGADRELTYLQPLFDAPVQVEDLRLYRLHSVEPGPDRARTQQLFEAGTAYWNSGIYAWQRGAIAAAIERYTPLFTMLGPAHHSEIALAAAYDRLQPVSLDEAVLVGAARDGQVLTLPLDVGWRELTS